MKVYYDTEFIDTGTEIQLLSIGMVAEDGREYYAIVSDLTLMTKAWNWESGGEFWLRKNVLNTFPLQVEGDYYLLWDSQHPDWINLDPRSQIRYEVKKFLQDTPEPELWAWYGAYDFVALAQLFGRMLDLPNGIPMWTNDLRQERHRLGNPRIPEQKEGNHNALEDAKWNREIGRYMESISGDFVANPKRNRNR